MMRWRKLGLIYGPKGDRPWMVHSALQPTPLLVDESRIRIYAGFRDAGGVSRIGFVDLDSRNPSQVIEVSSAPVLDIGKPGRFDENGVVPCVAVRRGKQVFLYYAGYQLGQKVRFYVYGGLAISEDGGNTFTRFSETPVLERADGEALFRVIHSISEEKSCWRAWYGAGSSFIKDGERTLPVYDIRYIESADGKHFQGSGRVVIPIGGGDEHRVARPNVFEEGGIFKMFYAVGTVSSGYRLGYAESPDGLNWKRLDEQLGLAPSAEGWDSTMMSYPARVTAAGNTYLFYNGNDYGHGGFGCAVREAA